MDIQSTATSSCSKPLEIWGGLECTINRVNDLYRDQLQCTGHYTRDGDIEAIASLGIQKIRYPVLWERHVTENDWLWTTKQLETIRNNKIEPIAGLIHHGSGPAFTDLLDPLFPEKLAVHAKEVAIRFPWIEYYTPVNEPLTTARFSGLYGLWYPHHQNELSFVKMLLNQVKGIILSMKAIREINPSAKLVQTEDLSKTHSTALLSYQADFENNRRWLTYDLLCGHFNPQNFFWNYFIRLGIDEAELKFFSENNCAPDIMGFNYYVTSERYLDERIEYYPTHYYGGNENHQYADVEAVRVRMLDGSKSLLKEAWERYHVPLAITECHINCTCDEQLRWFYENWQNCNDLIKEGIDVVSITAWALLGAYDWNSLLTEDNNYYEPGVFDSNNDRIQPTSLAKMISGLCNDKAFHHPLLYQKGWWKKKQARYFNKI